jgi:prolipoprotein diacylglyceryltransferase
MTLPGPRLWIFGRPVPAYRCFGLLGLGLSIALAVFLARSADIPVLAVAWVLAAGLAMTVAVLAMRTARGIGVLMWSEQEAGAVLVTVVIGTLLGRPLRLMDIIAPALMVILTAGRVGCLLAGCCHGRPARHGVRYGTGHAAAGFPTALIGVPLVPVQVVESVWAGLLAGTGTLLVLADLPPGATAVAVLGGRAAGRVLLESFRGDAGRDCRGRTTVPQRWAAFTSLLLLTMTAVGVLPVGAWTVSPAAAVVLCLITSPASPTPHVRRLDRC